MARHASTGAGCQQIWRALPWTGLSRDVGVHAAVIASSATILALRSTVSRARRWVSITTAIAPASSWLIRQIVHKSQGSEYPAVVIPVTTHHYPMLQRNLVYTAVTRGKRLVVLVGQRKALSIAVRGQQTRRRWSKLKEWLGD